MRGLVIDERAFNTINLREKKDKVLIYTMYPRIAEMVHKLLLFLGIDGIILDSYDTPDQRYKQIEREFNTSLDKKFMVAPFSLRMQGFNLQHMCARVICVDQAWNLATLRQATDRVHRIGQDEEQLVTRLHMPETVMGPLEEKLLAKTSSIVAATTSALDSVANATVENQAVLRMSMASLGSLTQRT